MKPGAIELKSRGGAAFLDDAHGGAAIIMAFMTPIIIGGLAFGAEIGGWEMTRRQLQNAADTAAFAAGTQVRSGADNDVIAAAAKAVAVESGYKGDDAGVVVEYPPATAPLAADGTDPNGDNAYVYVTLTQTQNRTFTKFFSASSAVAFQTAALVNIENGRPPAFSLFIRAHPARSLPAARRMSR